MTSGGTVNTAGNAYIANQQHLGGGTVSISDNAQWSIGRDLIVGNKAIGRLDIQSNGAAVGMENAYIAKDASSGESSVNVANAGTWSITKNLVVGDGARGLLAVATGGTVSVAGNATIANTAAASGSTVTVSNDGHTAVGGYLVVRSEGLLNVREGGHVSVQGPVSVGAGPGGSGVVTVTSQNDSIASLSIGGALMVGRDGRGRVDMEGNVRVSASYVSVWPDGEFKLAGVLDTPAFVYNAGILSGQGQVHGLLVNVGTLSPSLNMEVINFQTVAGRVVVDIGGVTPGTYSQITASNVADLGGSMDVRLVDEFMPELGDRFEIIRAALVKSDFDRYLGDVFRLGSTKFALVPVVDTDSVTLVTALAGDFNLNGVLDASDIDTLSTATRNGQFQSLLDIDKNRSLDPSDRNVWVKDLKNTYYGDANLDGEFDSLDLLLVLQQGKYEQDLDAGWSQGDWDGDGRFTSSDLLVALQDGGYEQGPRLAQVVPEPSAIALGVLVCLALVWYRHRPYADGLSGWTDT